MIFKRGAVLLLSPTNVGIQEENIQCLAEYILFEEQLNN